MRILKLLIMLVVVYYPTKAQNLDGTYTCDDQRFKIDGEKIEYRLILKGSGLSTVYTGTGTISVKNDRLLILPNNVKPSPSSLIERLEPQKKDSMYIFILGEEPEQAAINFYKNKKQVYVTMSGSSRIIGISRNKVAESDSISIGMVGYKPVGIRVDNLSNFDYEVILYPNSEENFHYDFVTNYGKGFKMEITPKGLLLEYERMVRHKPKQKWNKFKKTS